MRLTILLSLGLATIIGLVACSSSGSSNNAAAPDAGVQGDDAATDNTDGGDGGDATAASRDWEIKIPSASVSAMVQSASGDVFIAGDVLPGKTDFGAGEIAVTEDARLYVAKISAVEGRATWAKLFKITTTERGLLSLAPDATGGVHVLVGATGSVDFGGGAVDCSSTSGKPSFAWAHLDASGGHVKSDIVFYCRQGCARSFIARKDATLFFETSSDDNVDFGATVLLGDGTSSVLVHATDENLAGTGFTRGINGTSALGIGFDPAGHVVFAGAGGSGNPGAFTTAVSVVNDEQFFLASDVTTEFGAEALAFRAPVTFALTGVYVAGRSSSFEGFASIDVPATPKLSKVAWTAPLTLGTPDDYVSYVAAASDAEGNVVFVGSFAGKIIVSGTELVSSGGSNKSEADIYAIRLSPTGKPLGSKVLGGPTADYGRHVVALPNGRAIVGGEIGGYGYVASITF